MTTDATAGDERGAEPGMAMAGRVVLRPLGSSLPLGLVGVAVASGMLSVLELGWIRVVEGSTVGLVALAFAFPIQLVATVFAFLARDPVAGTGLGIFSGVWLTTGLSQLMSAPGTTSDAVGFFYILAAGALFLVVLAAAASGGKLILGLVVAIGATRVLVTGLYEIFGTSALELTAGTLGLVLSTVAFYAVLALLMEDAAHRTILPTLRRGGARTALRGDLSEQFARVQQEAGVREEL
jgi:succinate-acetate transporter protein